MDERLWHKHAWYKAVPREIDEFDKPVFSFIEESAESFPDQTYTIFNDGTRTFRSVNDTSNRIANFLIQRGIKKGDRVAIFLPNLPHYPAIFFGITKAGAACVTCNPMYKASELNYQLKDSGAKAVFVMDHPNFYPMACEAVKDTDVQTVVVCNVKSYLPALKGFLGGLLGKIPKAESHDPNHFHFDQAVAAASSAKPRVDIDPAQDLSVVIYTGGTTGLPKGAALTHSNFVYNVMAVNTWSRFVHEPGQEPETLRRGGYHTFLGVLPWYHSFGLTTCMLWAAYTGSKLVCVPDPRAGNPPFSGVLQAVQRYKTTIVAGVPTIYVAFANHPHLAQYDLRSVMACGSGGAPLLVEVAKRFEEATGAVLFEGYGLSETSPIVCLNPIDRDLRKFGSVGMPLPNTDVKIVDAENASKELARGEDGEIAVCGPQVMQGYWNRDKENEEVFQMIDGNRYFLTGDIGHLDEDGFVVITDRKKDLILVGGFNVYPRDVEEILSEHPKVLMSAVIGIPDKKSGEAVKAFVQLQQNAQATEEEIIAFCKDKLAGYKVPRVVEFRSELPTSTVGKVLRRVLRDEERSRSK